MAEEEAATFLAAKGIRFSSPNLLRTIGHDSTKQSQDIDDLVSKIESLQLHGAVFGRSSGDEVTLEYSIYSAAKLCGIPIMAVQDFWGDVDVETYRPDHYFVIDDLAAQLTKQKTTSTAHVIGSPKHARYADTDFWALRNTSHAELGVGRSCKVIGFFGQDLAFLPGYQQVIIDIGSLAAENPDVVLLYKPHPKEKQASIDNTMDLLRRCGGDPILSSRSSSEWVVASVDIVLSCFSTIALDAAYMMCAKHSPAVSIVFADYPEDVRQYWQPACGLPAFPLVMEGIALSAKDRCELSRCIQLGLTKTERERQQKKCQDRLVLEQASIPNTLKLIRTIARPNLSAR